MPNADSLAAQKRTPKMGSGEALYGAVVVAREAFERTARMFRRTSIPAEFRQPLPLVSKPSSARKSLVIALVGAAVLLLLGLIGAAVKVTAPRPAAGLVPERPVHVTVAPEPAATPQVAAPSLNEAAPEPPPRASAAPRPRTPRATKLETSR